MADLGIFATGEYRFKQWQSMASNLGLDVEFSDFGDLNNQDDARKGWESAQELLSSAQALVIHGYAVIVHGNLQTLLMNRIEKGVNTLIYMSGGPASPYSDLLKPFDLYPTEIKLVGKEGQRSRVTFEKERDCLRDPIIFSGVNSVCLDAPFAIWYGGDSWPIVVGSEDQYTVNAATDFPTDWRARELSCVTRWTGIEESNLIAVHGWELFADYADESKASINHNERLAENILRLFAKSVNTTVSPGALVERAELKLMDFTLSIIQQEDKDWWNNLIPLPIRKKCAERQEEERNKFPKEAYFDLTDLKTIIEKHWRLFEVYVSTRDIGLSKREFLNYLVKLNEIRRFFAHPLKVHVSGYSLTKEELEILKICDSMLSELFKKVDKQ